MNSASLRSITERAIKYSCTCFTLPLYNLHNIFECSLKLNKTYLYLFIYLRNWRNIYSTLEMSISKLESAVVALAVKVVSFCASLRGFYFFLYIAELFMQFFWCAGNEICPSRYIYILQRSACVLCDVCIARRDSRRRPSSLPPHFETLLPHLDRMFPFISIHFEDSLSSYITRTTSYLITSSRFGVDHYLIGNARPVMYD